MARPMTEEERLKQFIAANAMRSGMSAPMTMESQVQAGLQNVDPSKIPGATPSPQGLPEVPEQNPYYVAPDKDYSSEEATIANQRAYANTLRGAETPGLKTVGPYNVAVTNYAEGAETLGNRLLGGYLSGKADKKSKGLSKAKQDEAVRREQDLAKQAERTENTRIKELEEAEAADAAAVKARAEATVEAARVKAQGDAASDAAAASARTDAAKQLVLDRQAAAQLKVDERTDIRTEKAQTAAQKVRDKTADESLEKLGAMERADLQLGFAEEALSEGAQTGPIAAMLPTFRGASVKLQNARDNLALEKIGEFTFGSLSEAEGDWLKGTSIPEDLEEEELKPYLARRREGGRRAIKAEKYRIMMLRNGHQPDEAMESKIKYGPSEDYPDGFTFGAPE